MKSFPFFDIAAFAVGALSVYGFVGSYSEWSELRGFELAEDCLIALDSDCALSAINERYGERSTPPGKFQGENDGRWVWALRLLKMDGELDERLLKLTIDPDTETRSDYDLQIERRAYSSMPDRRMPPGSRLSALQLVRLTNVSEMIAQTGSVGTARRHRELMARIVSRFDPKEPALDSIQNKNFYTQRVMEASYSEFDSDACSYFLENYDELHPAAGSAERPVPIDDVSICYLLYFADRSDEDLREFIELYLDTMRTRMQMVGNADSENLRGVDYGGFRLEPFDHHDYVDRIAFLATIIAWRENDRGWGF